MTISRDWTPIDEDPRWEDEAYYDSVKPQADALARAWSVIQTEREQRAFMRQFDYEDGRYDDDFDDDESAAAGFRAADFARRLADELEQAQIDLIETKLSELGARMMRPYEHWNEDERLVAYMERDR